MYVLLRALMEDSAQSKLEYQKNIQFGSNWTLCVLTVLKRSYEVVRSLGAALQLPVSAQNNWFHIQSEKQIPRKLARSSQVAMLF